MKKAKINKQFLKYSASSFISSAAEEGAFLLLAWLLAGMLPKAWVDLLPMIIGRLVSCVINFYINQKLVFQSDRPMGVAFLRYMLQATPIAALQIILTFGTYALFSIGATQVALRGVIYAGIMIVLFVVSYILQKMWVFQATEKQKRGQKDDEK